MKSRHPLLELAKLFLKLGFTAFGGPAAHIALMEEEVVRRRKWMSREEFLDLLGATNLIPGPNSTEMAIHIGSRQAGTAGLLIAGICFIFPAASIVTAFAWMYVRYGHLPQIEGILYGVKPVMVAIVLQALWKLARSSMKTWPLAILGILAGTLSFLKINELAILLGAGFVAVALRERRRVHAWIPVIGGSVGSAIPFSLGPMFFFFLKVGSILFGSGYVLLAFLKADLVDRWHWLTESQLLDAIAIGQITPGPVFTTATFIGYVLGGGKGAFLATLGIFLPAFFFVAISGPLIPKMRRSPRVGAFLDGVIVASLALMTTVTWSLGIHAIHDVWTAIFGITSLILLLRFQWNSTLLILASGLGGLLRFLLSSS